MYKNNPNIFSIFLLLAHLFTDAIAAFVIVSIWINLWENISLENVVFSKILIIVVLYNALAFWWQIFIWYFFDKFQNQKLFFTRCVQIMIWSFFLYILWLLFLSFNIYLSVIFTGIASSLFHIWWGNVSVLTANNKSKYIWIFASGWVVWLWVWTFLALYNPEFIWWIIIWLIIISYFLLEFDFKNTNYEIQERKNNNWVIIFFILIALFLVYRSGVWSFENSKIIQLSKDFWIITFIAFFGKFFGWIFYDFLDEKYKKGFLTFCILLSFSAIFWNINIFIFVFLVQFLLSPAIFEMVQIFPSKKSLIIWFSFWLSLILWGIINLF